MEKVKDLFAINPDYWRKKELYGVESFHVKGGYMYRLLDLRKPENAWILEKELFSFSDEEKEVVVTFR